MSGTYVGLDVQKATVLQRLPKAIAAASFANSASSRTVLCFMTGPGRGSVPGKICYHRIVIARYQYDRPNLYHYERAIRWNQITVSGAENVWDVEQALGQRGTGACEPR